MRCCKSRNDINLDILIWLSELRLSSKFSEVSLIRDNQGRETVWLSKGLIIKPWKSWLSLNEWLLINTCKQLVWSTRIGRNMPIWNCHTPGSSVLGSPRSSVYRDVCVQASTSRLPEPTPLTTYRVVPQSEDPPLSSECEQVDGLLKPETSHTSDQGVRGSKNPVSRWPKDMMQWNLHCSIYNI